MVGLIAFLNFVYYQMVQWPSDVTRALSGYLIRSRLQRAVEKDEGEEE